MSGSNSLKSVNDTTGTQAPAGWCQKCHNPLGYDTDTSAGPTGVKRVSGIIAPRLPNSDELKADLEKLIANPNSVILIAIEASPDTQNYCDVGWGWFAADERKALKAAIQRARAKRATKDVGTTDTTEERP